MFSCLKKVHLEGFTDSVDGDFTPSPHFFYIISWQVAEASLALVSNAGAVTCQEPVWIDVHVTNSIAALSTDDLTQKRT